MNKYAFEQGFVRLCRSYGIDPERLVKTAQNLPWYMQETDLNGNKLPGMPSNSPNIPGITRPFEPIKPVRPFTPPSEPQPTVGPTVQNEAKLPQTPTVTTSPPSQPQAPQETVAPPAQPQSTTPQPRPPVTQPKVQPTTPGRMINKATTINGKPVEYKNYSRGTWGQNGVSYKTLQEMANLDRSGFKSYLDQQGLGHDALRNMTPQQRNQLGSNYYAGLSSQQKNRLNQTEAFKNLHDQSRRQGLENSMLEWDRLNNRGVNFNSKGIATNNQVDPVAARASAAQRAVDNFKPNVRSMTPEENINKFRTLQNQRDHADRAQVVNNARNRQIQQANRAYGGGSGGTFSYRDPRTGQIYQNLSMADFRRMRASQQNANSPMSKIR